MNDVMPIGRRTFFGSVSALAAAQAAPSAAPELEAELLEALDEIPLVNTHEHIIPEEERTSSRIDFFTLAGHYAISDVISAGLSGDDLAVVRNPDAPTEQRWRAFEPFWKSARMTGYGRALRIAIQDIYGVDQISGATLPEINRRIEAANRPGLYEEILIRRSNIAYSVLDDYWNAAPVRPDPRFFVCARKFDRFVAPQSASDIRNLEELTDVSITGLAGLKRAMETSFQQSLEIGMVTVKSTLAYNREIHYAEVEGRDAESSLQSLLGSEPHSARWLPVSRGASVSSARRPHVSPSDRVGSGARRASPDPYRPACGERQLHRELQADPPDEPLLPVPAGEVRPFPHELSLPGRGGGDRKGLPQRICRPLLGSHHLAQCLQARSSRISGYCSFQQDLRLRRRLPVPRTQLRARKDGAAQHLTGLGGKGQRGRLLGGGGAGTRPQATA